VATVTAGRSACASAAGDLRTADLRY